MTLSSTASHGRSSAQVHPVVERLRCPLYGFIVSGLQDPFSAITGRLGAVNGRGRWICVVAELRSAWKRAKTQGMDGPLPSAWRPESSAGAGSCGLPPRRRTAGTCDGHGDQSGVALWAEIPGEIGEHAVEQFVRVGRFRFGLVGRLTQAGTGLVELVAAGAVVQPVNAGAVGAFRGYVAQQAQNEVLRVEGEGGPGVLGGMRIGHGHTSAVVGADAPLGERAAANVAPGIF